MLLYPSKLLKSTKGISIISIIILTAVVVAALNAYAYFNPDFQLSKYSVVHLFRSYTDNDRKEDLTKIQTAIERYYDEHGEYPAYDGWCGRIISVLHPEAKDAITDYFGNDGIPQDPSVRGTGRDYFYRRGDRNNYVLMAVLEAAPVDAPTYNYSGCFDWPGNDVFNYRVEGSR